ncbi:Putative signal transducing protein [Amphritea atlantica]|uniref:Putative signal transducing protein n=1 Tax=Amphritea atlantica TaxID=355243 RepID=A0A1H9HZI1_9GAMM|nr:Putative signal transducing protein [Amphritea atlantica]
MKLLTEVIDVNELHSLRILLESNGIAFHVGNEDSARNFGFIYPARKYNIFILYEKQYDEAMKLLENEDHVVTASINLDQHRRFMVEEKTRSMNQIYKVVMYSFVVIVIIFACFVWYMEATH